MRNGVLFAQQFDPERGRLEGSPALVVEGVQTWFWGTHRALFSVSADGTLVFAPVPPFRRSTLSWFDRAGKRSEAVGGAQAYSAVALSPDLKRVVAGIADPSANHSDLWVIDLVKGSRSRSDLRIRLDLVAGLVAGFEPRRLRPHTDRRARRSTSATLRARLPRSSSSMLPISARASNLTDWSPDGSTLAFSVWRPKAGSNFDVWVLPLSGERKARPFVETKADEVSPVFSPDGKWIAYQSDESGRDEIYAQPFPGPGGKVQISTEGGSRPSWPRNGKDLIFLGPGMKLMASEVQTRPAWDAASPRPVSPDLNLPRSSAATRLRTGSACWLALRSPGTSSEGVRLVLNWPAELKK